MNNKKESDLLYFEDAFIKTYVHTIKRGILELCDKEEYKDGFRISYIPLDDNIKRKIIDNKTFVKDLCEKVAPKYYPYLCKIVIETQNEDDLEDLKITTIYFLKQEQREIEHRSRCLLPDVDKMTKEQKFVNLSKQRDIGTLYSDIYGIPFKYREVKKMQDEQLLKDIEKLMSKNGIKKLSIITEKGFLTKHYDLNMISSLMLAVNIIADKIIRSNELRRDQMDMILDDFVKIIKGNLKKNVRNEFN